MYKCGIPVGFEYDAVVSSGQPLGGAPRAKSVGLIGTSNRNSMLQELQNRPKLQRRHTIDKSKPIIPGMTGEAGKGQ